MNNKMKVLIVCSGNSQSGNNFKFEIDQAFIFDQMEALKKFNIEFDIFLISGKGIKGYLIGLKKLKKKLKNTHYDLIHAHNGLIALVANLQMKIPVVATFHGSDINNKSTRLISNIACLLSKSRIFVSSKLYSKLFIKPSKNYEIIPCGVDFDIFYPVKKEESRQKINFSLNSINILFGSAFNNPVKNFTLAKKSINPLIQKINIVELKNKSREEVAVLLNACDLLLLTSFSEGSPQVIKEAMACNCPIVSTDVGDVVSVIENTENCYISSYDSSDITDKISLVLQSNKRSNGREKIANLDNKLIAKRIINLYNLVIRN